MMSHSERNTWVYGLIAVLAYSAYLVVVVPQLLTMAPGEIAYRVPLLVCVAAAIAAGIAGSIVLGAVAAKGEPLADVRDVEISRLGERIGLGALVTGAVLALVLAMLSAEHFWIANTIYLGFVAQAVLSSAVRLMAYRGVGPW